MYPANKTTTFFITAVFFVLLFCSCKKSHPEDTNTPHARSFLDSAKVISDLSAERYAHQASTCIMDGVSYTVYNANESSVQENQPGQCVKLSVFKISDPNQKKIITVCLPGEKSGGINVTGALTGGGQVLIADSNTVRILFYTHIGGDITGSQSRMLYKDYSITDRSTGQGTLGVLNKVQCTIAKNIDSAVDLTVDNVVKHMMYLFGDASGAKYGTGISMPTDIVTAQGYWWSSIQIKDKAGSTLQTCVVARSKDAGQTWELLGAPNPEKLPGGAATLAEFSLTVTPGAVAAIMRTNGGLGIMASIASMNDLYNFPLPVKKYPNSLGKPFVINYGGSVGYVAFLPGNIVNRTMVDIVKISSDFQTWSKVATVFSYDGIHTFTGAMYNGRGYVCWTSDSRHQVIDGRNTGQINFGEYKREWLQ